MLADLEQLLHRVVKQARQARCLPGGVVGVVTPGQDGGPEPWTAVVPFGTADVAGASSVGPDTIFETSSLSELFTALLLATVSADPACVSICRPCYGTGHRLTCRTMVRTSPWVI